MEFTKKVRNLKRKLPPFRHRLAEHARRLCAVVICASLVLGGFPSSFFQALAADDSGEYVYEFDKNSIYEALDKAIEKGTTLDNELRFLGDHAGEYDELFDPDGTLYELKDLEPNDDAERDKNVGLRVFVRLKGDIDLDEDYEIDGNEDVIFLLTNKTDIENYIQIVLEDRESEMIAVPPAKDIPAEISEDLAVTLSPSTGGGSGSNGSGDEISIEIEPDDGSEPAATGEDSAVTVEDGERSDSEDVDDEGYVKDSVDSDGSKDEDSSDSESASSDDTESGEKSSPDTDSKSEDSTSSENSSEKSDAGDSSDGKDTSSDKDHSDNKDSSHDKKSSDDKDASKDKDSSHKRGSSRNRGSSGDKDSSDKNSDSNAKGEKTVSVSVNRTVVLTASLEAGFEEDETDTTEAETGNAETEGSDVTESTVVAASPSDASPSDASPSDASRIIIDGTVYEPVRLGRWGAVAFVTTTQDLGLDNSIYYTASDGDVVVTVGLPAGALPRNAELAVTLHDEDSPEYADALELINEYRETDEYREAASAADGIMTLSSEEEDDNEDKEGRFTFFAGNDSDRESGMISMDISFYVDGEKVEPSAEADVIIDASAVPEINGAVLESLEVWHMEETDDGIEPVLVAEITDPAEAADGVAEFSVESFSEFEFHYNYSGGGWAGFGTNLLDEKGNTISATVTGNYDDELTNGRYTTEVDMPYTLYIDKDLYDDDDKKGRVFIDDFTLDKGTAFLYATVTDPNYGDTNHEFDIWPGEEQVGAKDLYGSEDNPVVSVTINGTAATENPNYKDETVHSKTWHFTLTYADDTSDTIPIYGNADGADDNGGKYCPKYLEINLYYKEAAVVVLNLGNGNGTYSDGDYTGSNASGGSELRYTTEGGALDGYAGENGILYISLPSDDDLGKSFTLAQDNYGILDPVTVELGCEKAYDYKLVGWVNIATGEYYDVSKGSATARIDTSNDNVFYADWIAASYDKGSSSDAGLREDTVSTSDFVNFDLFDFNELFDLYSVSLEQNGTSGETWTDSGNFYSEPLLSKEGLTPIEGVKSFIFQNNGTTRSNVHVLSHANPARWNLWTSNSVWNGYEEYGFVLDADEYWKITSPESTILSMLYDKSEQSLGVHYVGPGDYLFWVDDNGYYTYDSAVSGAAYNQTDERFYVYKDNKNAFFPYNGHDDERTSSNGMTDYWFGMSMDVDFYLPNPTSSGSENEPVNQVNDKDMIFDFSGDDDIMIFVDGKMVCDMSGIHSTSYSRINFSTNTVTYSMSLDADGAPDIASESVKHKVDTDLDLSAGSHKMQIFYMERGASESNLKIQFNLTPAWEYETGDVQTVVAEKTWARIGENGVVTPIDPDDLDDILPDVYKTEGIEVGLFDILTEKADGTFGYTRSGTTYTVTYEDDSGKSHTYIYDSAGPSLTYDGITYSEVSDGKVLDNEGYVIAWLEDEKLHIRMDRQTLSSTNGWTYTWELLDPDGNYEVLELSEDPDTYSTTNSTQNLQEYMYWSIIGEKEIESYLADNSGEPLAVILTEAAQETNETLGDTKEALGWVIIGSEDGITTKQVKFSQIATLDEITDDATGTTTYHGTYGVTSQSEIEALGSGAVWFIEDAENQTIDSLGDLEEFYLYCLIDGEKYYLALNESADSLTITNSSERGAVFYYDALGELMVDVSGDGGNGSIDRVEIDENGSIKIGEAEDKAATDDVRIYTLTDTKTSGFTFTAVNTLIPDIDLIKVDADSYKNSDEYTAISGMSFTLRQSGEGGLYYKEYDPDIGKAIWSEIPVELTTDENGKYTFHYLPDGEYILTEVTAADGYILLPGAIIIQIVNGVIYQAIWEDETLRQDSEYRGFILRSDGGLELIIKNQLGGSRLPDTGGSGTMPFEAAGMLIISGAVWLYITLRRRRRWLES